MNCRNIFCSLVKYLVALRRTVLAGFMTGEGVGTKQEHHFFLAAAAFFAFALAGDGVAFFGLGALGFLVGALAAFFALDGAAAFLGFLAAAGAPRLATAAAAVTLRLPPAALLPPAFLPAGFAAALAFLGLAPAARFAATGLPLAFSGLPDAEAGSLKEPDAPLPEHKKQKSYCYSTVTGYYHSINHK